VLPIKKIFAQVQKKFTDTSFKVLSWQVEQIPVYKLDRFIDTKNIFVQTIFGSGISSFTTHQS